MQIYYRNINKGFTNKKQEWFDRVMEVISPSILCLAEGPENFGDCESLVRYFNDNGYWSFYDPTFYKKDALKAHLNWNKYGLKNHSPIT